MEEKRISSRKVRVGKDVYKRQPKTVEALMGLELPAGVEIEIKL